MPVEKKPYAFVTALKKLMAKCGVENLKMSDYGITKEEIPTFAKNARETMGGLFNLDRYKLSLEETIEIIKEAYK